MRLPSLRRGGRVRLPARRVTAPVALDISADAIVALQLHSDGASARRAIVHPLPAGVVVDGEVIDPGALAEELRSLFADHGLPREVRVGIAHPRLMVRLVELPDMLEGGELDSAVRHLASDLLPVGLDQLIVDYRPAGASPGVAGAGMQRILMAAARADGIAGLTSALDGADLQVKAIGLSGLAMVSALEQPPISGEAILYVQIGALTNVVITENGHPLLVRAASAGSEAIAAGLAERAGVDVDAARGQVSRLGLGAAPHHGAPAPIPDDLQAAITQQVREGLRRIVAEVQSSRGVYAARPDASPIGGVVLTGSMTAWPGVAQALRDELRLPVIPAEREGWPRMDGLAIAPERLDVAVGLARQSRGARPDLRPAAVAHRRASPMLSGVATAACAMLALLAAAIVYLVAISNQVSSGREQLGEIATELVQTERQAAALKPYDDFAKATVARRQAVATIAGTHFNWDRSLIELAKVTPSGVWLTSVKGTLTPATEVEGGAAGGPTGSLRGALPVPALELAGCAVRESMVPAFIDRLTTMTRSTEVGFSRSERLTKSTGNAPSTGGGDDCRDGDQRRARFALVTYFEADPAAQAVAAAAAPAGTPAAAAAATPPKPAQADGAQSTPKQIAPNQTASATTGGSR